MRKSLLAMAFLTLSSAASAAPFVVPAKWSVSSPAEVKPGGIYRTSTISDYKTLNPFTSAESGNIPFLLSAGSFFTLDPITKEYIPYMAESFKVSPNKLVWTMNIRKGMKWSDGKPIVADDFVVAAKIHADEDVGSNSYDSFYQNNKPIKILKVDADTVTVTFPAVKVDAIEFFSDGQTWPQPAHVFQSVYEAKGATGIKGMWTISEKPENIVSAGPFKLESYRTAEKASFVKNPTYGEWNKDSAGNALPYLDGRSIAIVKDLNAQLAAFLGGQLDAFAPSNADQLSQVKRAIDAGNLKAVLRASYSPAASSSWIAFNMNRKSNPLLEKAFRSTEFRRAMSHLANRAAMIDIALGGFGEPAYSSVYAVFKEWVSPNLKKYDFNPEQAKALLAKIGFSKKNSEGYLTDRTGKVLEFDLNTNAGNNVRENLAKIFADEAKKVGVKVNFKPIDFNTLVQKLLSEGDDRPFDAILLGLSGGGILYPLGENVEPCGTNLHAYNKSGKCLFPWESQVTALFFRGQQELDTAKRKQIAYQIQNIQSEQQGLIYLVSPKAHASWLSSVRGELPEEVADANIGTRQLDMTWINK
jgi:peptide/nickel transport system substrate-binding protein